MKTLYYSNVNNYIGIPSPRVNKDKAILPANSKLRRILVCIPIVRLSSSKYFHIFQNGRNGNYVSLIHIANNPKKYPRLRGWEPVANPVIFRVISRRLYIHWPRDDSPLRMSSAVGERWRYFARLIRIWSQMMRDVQR